MIGDNTLYSNALELSIKLGKEYTPILNTTLNDKYNINTPLPDTGTYELKFFSLGLNSDVEYSIKRHKSTDGALFEHLPIYMYPVNESPNVTTDSYRLKTIETYGGVEYYCYYGKLLNSSITNVNLVKMENIDDNVTLSYITEMDSEVLNPIYETDITTDVCMAMDKVYVNLTNDEITRIKSYALLIYGLSDFRISEIGLMHGIDNKSINEVYGCQMSNFIYVDYSIDDLLEKDSVSVAIDLGGMVQMKVNR